MSWAIRFDSNWNRDIGYGVPAFCDFPGCYAEIDRGLSYVCCSQEPYGGDKGCGLYFCYDHAGPHHRCSRCTHGRDPFKPSPDHPDWIRRKWTDPSWAPWRAEQPSPTSEGPWQPIESAPKDHTDVLVWLRGNRTGQLNERAMVCRHDGYSGWSIPGIGGLAASHWMVAPTAPDTEGKV